MTPTPPITVRVRYWSWFKDLAGTDSENYEVPGASTLETLRRSVEQRHPRFAEARGCALVAVGVEYRPPTHVLQPGDEVSFFPPVQGG